MMHFPRPTIAMVNGWCFGGAFHVLIGCDLAIAAEDARFGLSEINWGIIPAGIVTKSVSQVMSQRDALYYIMTGDSFDGRQAAEMRLVNVAVPADRLREETVALAGRLMEKNSVVLHAARTACHHVRSMSRDHRLGYLTAKCDQTGFRDPEKGGQARMRRFLDEKRRRPGLQAFRRDA